MRKNDPTEDLEWFHRVFAGADPVSDPLDEDQRLVRNSIGRILTLLLAEREKLDNQISEMGRLGLPSTPQVKEKARALEWDRVTVVNAIDLVFCLVANRDHPIHRFSDASRRHVGAGRRPPSLREAALRCILVAFVRSAMKRLGLNESEAAALASESIRGLGSKDRSVKAIKGWTSNDSFGAYGEAAVNEIQAEMEQVPPDQLAKYLRLKYARNLDNYALYKIDEYTS